MSDSRNVSPALRFGSDIADLSEAFIARLVSDEESGLSGRARKRLPEAQRIVFGSGRVVFHDKPPFVRQVGSLVGSTHFAIAIVEPPIGIHAYIDPTKPAYRSARNVDLLLFYDGSPYVSDQDLKYDCDNSYRALVAPDMPPVLINLTYLDLLAKPKPGAAHGDIEEVGLIAEQFGPKAVHSLRDSACETILRGLRYSMAHDVNIPAINEYYHDINMEFE